MTRFPGTTTKPTCPSLTIGRPHLSWRGIFGLVAALAAGAACSETGDRADRASSNTVARAILDSVRASAGGAETLEGIRNLAVQYVHTRYVNPTQSGVAVQARSIDVVQVRDFDNGRQFYERRATGENGDWERVVIVPGAAFRIDRRTNEVAVFSPDAESAALYSGLEFRWYVYSALNEASFAASSLQMLPDTTAEDRTYHVLSFQGTGTETNYLWIDTETLRITRRHLEAFDPVTGRASTTLTYRDYEDVGGLPMPMTVDIAVNDQPFEQFELQDVRINGELQDSAFEPPQG